MKKINPLNINKGNLPLFVCSDDNNAFMSWAIRKHTKAQYSHTMMMVEPGFFATQGMMYKSVPVEHYMKPNIHLKFWKYKTHDKDIGKQIIEMTKRDLKLPWWKRRYDFAGIIGQLLPFKWTRKFNIPWRKYCSERVADYVRVIYPEFKNIHPTPSEINEFFKKQNEMVIKGYWYCEE